MGAEEISPQGGTQRVRFHPLEIKPSRCVLVWFVQLQTISHHFWKQSLSSDPAILGKTISVNGATFDVIGVMPEAFYGIKRELEPPEIWAPMTMQTIVMKHPSLLMPVGKAGGTYFLNVFGRLSAQASTNKSSLSDSDLAGQSD